MAPKKKPAPKGRPPEAVAVTSLVSLKGSADFEKWLDGLVEHMQFGTRTLTMKNALRALAKSGNYKPEMPKR